MPTDEVGPGSAGPESIGYFPSVPSRRRFVSSIREVVDADGVQVISNEIYRAGPDRRAEPSSPLRHQTVEELHRFGFRPTGRPLRVVGMKPAVVACALGLAARPGGDGGSWRAVVSSVSCGRAAASRVQRSVPGRPDPPGGPSPPGRIPESVSRGGRGGRRGVSPCWSPVGRWPSRSRWSADRRPPEAVPPDVEPAAIARIEAIAMWTEMLHGTLTASAGLGQAIIATAPLAPPPIRPATARLSARLTGGSAATGGPPPVRRRACRPQRRSGGLRTPTGVSVSGPEAGRPSGGARRFDPGRGRPPPPDRDQPGVGTQRRSHRAGLLGGLRPRSGGGGPQLSRSLRDLPRASWCWRSSPSSTPSA